MSDPELNRRFSQYRPLQKVCNSFSEGEKAVGAGFKGIEEDGSSDAILQLSGNMFATYRLVVDDEYLYIAEHRYDLVPLYKNKTFREPYKADGSMFWFTLNGSITAGIQRWTAPSTCLVCSMTIACSLPPR